MADMRSLIARLAELEDAARTVPVVAAGDASAAVNPDLQHIIDEERLIVAQIRALRAAGVVAEVPRGESRSTVMP